MSGAGDRDCQLYVIVRGHEVILVRDATREEALAKARLIVQWEPRTVFVRDVATGEVVVVERAPTTS
ncbi:MAG: hypothetical protein ACHREM_13895 [Polyangiales bacterium]